MEFHRTTVAQQFGRRTLVGNWFEDQVLHEQKVKEYIQRKDNGLLYSGPGPNGTPSAGSNSNAASNDAQVSASSGLSVHADGVVRYGDVVLVLSTFTQGLLTVAPATKQLTTSLAADGPVPTNMFVIDPPLAPAASSAAELAYARSLPSAAAAASGAPSSAGTLAPRKELYGSPLRFGGEFRLRLHPALTGDDAPPVYLASAPVALATSLKHKQQQLTLTAAATQDTAFRVALKDVAQRPEAHGAPVLSDQEVLLTHLLTNQALCSGEVDPATGAPTVRATQYPATAHTALPASRPQPLYGEATGSVLAELPLRAELPSNGFALLLGSDAP